VTNKYQVDSDVSDPLFSAHSLEM